MKTNTKQQIIDLINSRGQIRPNDLVQLLGFNATVIHRHLKQLIESEQIKKVGHSPVVFYVPKSSLVLRESAPGYNTSYRHFLDTYYLYFTPDGELIKGEKGFLTWVEITRQTHLLPKLIQEYVRVRKTANRYFKRKNRVEATKKFKDTYALDRQVDQVYYQDFYSLPKFGRTKLGQLVLYAKQGQLQAMIEDLARDARPIITSLIKEFKIDAVAIVPPSIKRRVQFLKVFSRHLKLRQPLIDLAKVSIGPVVIAQKTLPKLQERVLNVRNTIFIKETNVKAKRVLIIDDAVGSGATFNEIARKLKCFPSVKKVFGFAVVGSMKGFEVIQEV